MAIVVTPGASNANAYVTVAEADTYHERRPPVGTTWSSATDDQKEAAILWASKLMDALWEWNGYAVDAVQAMLWPRGGMLKRNRWEYVSTTVIPPELKDATSEFARQLLAGDRTGDSSIETLGLTSLKAGPVELAFKNAVYAKPVPDIVVNLIPSDWGYPRMRSTGVRDLVRD